MKNSYLEGFNIWQFVSLGLTAVLLITGDRNGLENTGLFFSLVSLLLIVLEGSGKHICSMILDRPRLPKTPISTRQAQDDQIMDTWDKAANILYVSGIATLALGILCTALGVAL